MKFFKKQKKPIVIIIVFTMLIVGLFFVSRFNTMNKTNIEAISSFEECVAAGYPVMESYPERCKTPDGKTFTKQIATRQEIIIKGEMVCLPHKESGPQTLECAYGLKDENGLYYGLKDSDPSYKNISSLEMGQPVQIKGILREETNTIYQSVGVIEVVSISQ